jgi:hypothetical protein
VCPGDVAAWRAAESLVELWPSIQGAALTTCVAAASLVGCTIQIFVKMGLTLLGCTLLSALFALFVLPGLLLCFAQSDAQPLKPPKLALRRSRSRSSVGESQEDGHVDASSDANDGGGEEAAENRAELGQASSSAGAADAPRLAEAAEAVRFVEAETPVATNGARLGSGFLRSLNRSPHRSNSNSGSSWAQPAPRNDRPSLDRPVPTEVELSRRRRPSDNLAVASPRSSDLRARVSPLVRSPAASSSNALCVTGITLMRSLCCCC